MDNCLCSWGLTQCSLKRNAWPGPIPGTEGLVPCGTVFFADFYVFLEVFFDLAV